MQIQANLSLIDVNGPNPFPPVQKHIDDSSSIAKAIRIAMSILMGFAIATSIGVLTGASLSIVVGLAIAGAVIGLGLSILLMSKHSLSPQNIASIVDKSIVEQSSKEKQSPNHIEPKVVRTPVPALKSSVSESCSEPSKQDHIPSPPLIRIPSKKELESLSEVELHRLWKLNTETLIGVIASETIPKFGFHGTDAGEEILKSRISRGLGGEIYVAGCTAQLDPITFLADLYTTASKAEGYGRDILVVRTETARYYKNITGYSFFETRQSHDSEQDKSFLKFTWRNKGSDSETCNITKEDLEEYRKDRTISSKCFFPASELKLTFNPKNFDERVKGVFLRNQQICNASYFENMRDTPRRILGYRFQIQELIMYAFKKIDVKQNKSSQEYQTVGSSLIQQMDKVTRIAHDQLSKINKKFYVGLLMSLGV